MTESPNIWILFPLLPLGCCVTSSSSQNLGLSQMKDLNEVLFKVSYRLNSV